MRVDWCVSSWFRIKNTHSLTHSRDVAAEGLLNWDEAADVERGAPREERRGDDDDEGGDARARLVFFDVAVDDEPQAEQTDEGREESIVPWLPAGSYLALTCRATSVIRSPVVFRAPEHVSEMKEPPPPSRCSPHSSGSGPVQACSGCSLLHVSRQLVRCCRKRAKHLLSIPDAQSSAVPPPVQ